MEIKIGKTYNCANGRVVFFCREESGFLFDQDATKYRKDGSCVSNGRKSVVSENHSVKTFKEMNSHNKKIEGENHEVQF